MSFPCSVPMVFVQTFVFLADAVALEYHSTAVQDLVSQYCSVQSW
jgi:hypothetical protein